MAFNAYRHNKYTGTVDQNVLLRIDSAREKRNFDDRNYVPPNDNSYMPPLSRVSQSAQHHKPSDHTLSLTRTPSHKFLETHTRTGLTWFFFLKEKL